MYISVSMVILLFCMPFGCGGGGISGRFNMVRFVGKVVDEETKKPVVGARVVINGVKTDSSEEGVFELDVAIPVGVSELPITISKHGYRTLAQRWRVPQQFVSPYKFESPFELSRYEGSGTIKGKVIAGDTNKGIVNARVTVTINYTSVYGWTDNDGEFILSGISPGEAKVEVEHTDFIKKVLSTPITVDREISIGDVVLLRIGQPISVVGYVLDAESYSPVSGAKVSIANKEATTDFEGKFELSGVPSGMQSITISHPSYEPFEGKVMIKGEELTFYITPKGALPSLPFTIGGIVTVAGGQPARNATVELIDAKTNLTVGITYTDANGRYGFFVLPGEYKVSVKLSGYKPQERDVTLPYGGIVIADVNFELQPL